jgi:AbrB family looped-hinge helix DNA binding protein
MAERTKVTSKGQVTIPATIRHALNIDEGDYLVFESISEYEVNVKVVKTQPLSSLLGALKSDIHLEDLREIRTTAYDSRTELRYTKEE